MRRSAAEIAENLSLLARDCSALLLTHHSAAPLLAAAAVAPADPLNVTQPVASASALGSAETAQAAPQLAPAMETSADSVGAAAADSGEGLYDWEQDAVSEAETKLPPTPRPVEGMC